MVGGRKQRTCLDTPTHFRDKDYTNPYASGSGTPPPLAHHAGHSIEPGVHSGGLVSLINGVGIIEASKVQFCIEFEEGRHVALYSRAGGEPFQPPKNVALRPAGKSEGAIDVSASSLLDLLPRR